LFEQSEIDLPRPNLDSLPQGQKRLSKMASKLPFTAIRFNDDGDVYAVYLGKKHKDKPGSERTKALGAGAFGTVKLAQNQRTGDLLALKVQTVYDNDPVRAKKKLDAIKEEYNKLKRLGLAEGMVEHKGIDIDGNAWTKISIGMTLIRGMDVSDFIEDKNRELSQTRWLEIATNTINALAKFDIDGPYIHRDVKPPNFMINPDTGEVIVVDVGLAKAKAPDGLVEGGAGTPDYIAPEMFTGMPVDFKADIYSLGKTLAEMLNLAYHDPIVSDLYDKTKDIRVLHNYIRVREPNDPTFQDPSQLRITDKDIRDQVIAMLKKMTDLNPCNRPNFTEVSQFFSEMKLEVLNATDKLRKVAVFDAAEYLSYKEGSRGRAAMIEALKAADEVTLLDTQLNRSDYNYMALQKELEQQGIHLGSQLLTATDNKSTAVDVLSDAVNQIERQQPNEVRNYVYVTTKKMTSKMVEKLHANDINYMTAISTKNSKDYRDEILLFARNQTLSMSKFVSVIKPTLDDEINRLSGKNSNRAKQRKAIIEKYLDEFLKTNPNKPFNMDYMLAKLNQLQSEIREHRKVFASKTEKLITQTIKKATVQPIVNQATASISGMFAPKQPLTDMPLNSAKVTNAPTKKKSSSS
jgi:serine/threonine protein kinase